MTNPHWLIIQGMGAGLTSISGSCTEARKDRDTKECGTLKPEKGEEFPVLSVAPTGAVWLLNVTIKNGQDTNGAGIFNEGALMVYSSTVMSNHAHNSGGGIYNKSGWTYLQDSTVSNNVIHQAAGGGIYIEAGIVDIAYSTINGNKTWNAVGAGIANKGGLNIFNSTISGNTYTKRVRIRSISPTRVAYSTQGTARYG